MKVDSLRAHLTTLENLGRRTAKIPETMSGTGRLLDRYAEDVGSDEVVDALGDFESHWRDGRGKIRTKSETLGSMLSDTVRELRATDDQLTKNLETAAETRQVTPGGRRPV